MNIEQMAALGDQLLAAEAAGPLNPEHQASLANLARAIGATEGVTTEELGVQLALQHGDLVLTYPQDQE